MMNRTPEHFSDPKVIALQTALHDKNPFYSARCAIQDHQRFLYYTHDDVLHRVDLTGASADDLDALYRACEPAEFGKDGENVLDDSYRKAGKMDLVSFSTLFDPRRLGIHEQVSKMLLAQDTPAIDMELYKLNVYGKGDFFKSHKDTPRGQDMFGSLVVVFPIAHEGGQLVLRRGKTEWTIDFTDELATATEPSVCFVAFFGDMEHEVLPVTSGHRVTLTYNLYHTPTHPSTSATVHPKLKQALADLVNDKSKLPNGGYLGFGLVHEYVHKGRGLLASLPRQLKGADRALADACDALGLSCSFRLFYRQIDDQSVHLIATDALDLSDMVLEDDYSVQDGLRDALEPLGIDDVEGVVFSGETFDTGLFRDDNFYGYGEWLRDFYEDPATEVMEVTRMKSSAVGVKTPIVGYAGNQAMMDYFYGTACMLITVGAAELRAPVGV